MRDGRRSCGTWAAALVLVSAVGAEAEEFDATLRADEVRTAVAACFEAACVGDGMAVCQATDPGAPHVLSGICAGEEAAVWEGRIASVMAALTGPGAMAEAFADRVDWPIPRPTLENVQVTFEAYRDAACDMEGALWGNGSGAGPAWMVCRMRVNAEHALRLEAWMESVE